MSILGRRVAGWQAALGAGAILVAVAAIVAATGTAVPDREIVLVARNMAFYLESDPATPNPPIRVQAGERVRLVLRNDDRGYLHDLAVPAWDAAVPLVQWSRSVDVTVTVPDVPGTYEYVCQPHRLMMRGPLVVVSDAAATVR